MSVLPSINQGSSSASTSSNDANINASVVSASCSICLDEPCDDPVVTTCGHSFCRVCIHHWLQASASTCPNCRASISEEWQREHTEQHAPETPSDAKIRRILAGTQRLASTFVNVVTSVVVAEATKHAQNRDGSSAQVSLGDMAQVVNNLTSWQWCKVAARVAITHAIAEASSSSSSSHPPPAHAVIDHTVVSARNNGPSRSRFFQTVMVATIAFFVGVTSAYVYFRFR